MNAKTLELHECEVTAARAHETRRGLAFSGLLWVRGHPIASFQNAGEGGCNWYKVNEHEAFAEYEDLARCIAPMELEHTDHVTGILWDWAMLRGEANAAELFQKLYPAKDMPIAWLAAVAGFTAMQRKKKLDGKRKPRA